MPAPLRIGKNKPTLKVVLVVVVVFERSGIGWYWRGKTKGP